MIGEKMEENTRINPEDFKNAAIEAIYCWNRTEYFYHKYFSKLDELYKNKYLRQFFTDKIFETFLREYSIRRNISAGYKKVDMFIDEIIEMKFVKYIKSGNVDAIDCISQQLKDSERSTNRETKSLLSKIAFLINPNDFSLYDSICKKSVGQLMNNCGFYRGKYIDNYSNYIVGVNCLLYDYSKILEQNIEILKILRETSANKYLLENPGAYKRRILDKYLWLYQQKQNINARPISNKAFREFLKYNVLS